MQEKWQQIDTLDYLLIQHSGCSLHRILSLRIASLGGTQTGGRQTSDGNEGRCTGGGEGDRQTDIFMSIFLCCY